MALAFALKFLKPHLFPELIELGLESIIPTQTQLEALPLQFQQPLPTAPTPTTSLPLNLQPPPLPFIPFDEPFEETPLPSLFQRKVKRVKRVKRVNRKKKAKRT